MGHVPPTPDNYFPECVSPNPSLITPALRYAQRTLLSIPRTRAEFLSGCISADANPWHVFFPLVLPIHRDRASVPRYDRWTSVWGEYSLHRDSKLVLTKRPSFVLAYECRPCKSPSSTLCPYSSCVVADEPPLFFLLVYSVPVFFSLAWLPRAFWFFQFAIPPSTDGELNSVLGVLPIPLWLLGTDPYLILSIRILQLCPRLVMRLSPGGLAP